MAVDYRMVVGIDGAHGFIEPEDHLQKSRIDRLAVVAGDLVIDPLGTKPRTGTPELGPHFQVQGGRGWRRSTWYPAGVGVAGTPCVGCLTYQGTVVQHDEERRVVETGIHAGSSRSQVRVAFAPVVGAAVAPELNGVVLADPPPARRNDRDTRTNGSHAKRGRLVGRMSRISSAVGNITDGTIIYGVSGNPVDVAKVGSAAVKNRTKSAAPGIEVPGAGRRPINHETHAGTNRQTGRAIIGNFESVSGSLSVDTA